jgi:hypothetical protein
VLRSVHLQGVGPVDELGLTFARRTNIVTGDNGLGKTFLLDIVWWVLTREWAGSKALPAARPRRHEPRIHAVLTGRSGDVVVDRTYDFGTESWPIDADPPAPGVVLYARVDGGFAVADPLRTGDPAPFVFTAQQVWNGLRRDDGVVLCNGLIADVLSWQLESQDELARFDGVLAQLSPPEFRLALGRPTQDARDVPMLEAPYGPVPLTHVSAGIKRVLALAYLLTWAWQKHRSAAERRGVPPDRQVVLLVDEIEAHLHPKWQHRVLPALRGVVDGLASATGVQLVCATHSPVILASVDPYFDPGLDALTRLELEPAGEDGRAYPVAIREVWAPRSDASAWLASEVFDGVGSRAPRIGELVSAFAAAVDADDAESALAAYRALAAIVAPEDDDLLRLRGVLRSRGWYRPAP